MTKAELIERIMDHLVDPWTDACEDYADADLITIDQAEDMMTDLHAYDIDLEPEEILPAEVTPELVMEAYNCHVRAQKHELRIRRLTEWMENNDPVCLHDNYYRSYPNSDPSVLPTDFFFNCDRVEEFPFGFEIEYPDLAVILRAGMNSVKTFSFDDEYCWYDAKKNQLFSTDHPFRDVIIDARAMAEFFIDDAGDDAFQYLLGEMDDDDIRYVFGFDREDVKR